MPCHIKSRHAGPAPSTPTRPTHHVLFLFRRTWPQLVTAHLFCKRSAKEAEEMNGSAKAGEGEGVAPYQLKANVGWWRCGDLRWGARSVV